MIFTRRQISLESSPVGQREGLAMCYAWYRRDMHKGLLMTEPEGNSPLKQLGVDGTNDDNKMDIKK